MASASFSNVFDRRKSDVQTLHQCTVQMFMFAALIACNMLLPPNTHASNTPNLNIEVDFNVREQNVNDFLQALFQEINVPLAINAELDGNINGKFKDTAASVFSEIASAFDLVVYYDGAVAQAYRNNQITRRMMPVGASSAKRVKSIVGKMNLPDSRNTIEVMDSGLIVSGTTRFIEQVEEVLQSVKKTARKAVPKRAAAPAKKIAFPNESPIVYQTFKLKHAWAIDTSFPVGGQTITIPGVATILKQLIVDSSGPVQGAGGASVDPVDHSQPIPLKGSGLNGSRTPTTQVMHVAGGTGPRIVADSRLNAIIIRDKANKMAAYQRLIESLDVESGMVEIEATIIDINTDKTRELGINWRYQGDDGSVLFGSGTPLDGSLVPGNNAVTQGRGGILSFMLGEPRDFIARIQLLEEQGAARIVSKPHVITLSDVEAVLAATTEFFVRVAGEEEVDLFNVPVGTTLRVTPHVFTDNHLNKIKLLVNIEDGTQSSATQVDNIPVIERANISTQAVVTEGDSLLVGGLVRETYRNTRYQVPVLGRVPLIGGLFRSKQNQATRVERLFLITPRLAAGFNGGNRATLAGSSERIVNDAAGRIRASDFADRPAMNYKPRKSTPRANTSVQSQSTDLLLAPGTSTLPTPGTSTSPAPSTKPMPAPLTRPVVVREIAASELDTAVNQQTSPLTTNSNEFAVIKDDVFITPFSVKPW